MNFRQFLFKLFTFIPFKIIIILLIAACFIGFFQLFFTTAGYLTALFALIPIAVSGLFFGLITGAFTGFLFYIITIFLLITNREFNWDQFIKSIPFGIVQVIIGYTAGLIKELLDKIKRQSEELIYEKEVSISKINELVKTEKALFDSKEYLNKIINTIADPVCVKDSQHQWVLSNDAHCTFIGYSREELLGKSDYDFFPKYQADIFWEKDEIVFDTGKENINEEEFTDAGGKTHIILTKKNLYTNSIGEKFIVVVFSDISERKQSENKIQKLNLELEKSVRERTEQLITTNIELTEDIAKRKLTENALRESENLFRAIFECSALGIALTDPGTRRFIRANRTFQDLVAYSENELMELTFDEMTHPDDVEENLKIYKEIIEGRTEIIRFEKRYIRKDGKPLWVHITGSFARDVFNNPKFMIIMVENIEPRKIAEQNLATEKERLSVTLKSIGDGVIATDINGRIVLMNNVAEDLTGWSLAESEGKQLTEVFKIINEKTRKKSENPIEKVIYTGEIVGLSSHTLLISKEGREMSISDSGAPIRDSKNNIIGVVLVFRDITDKKRLEEKIFNAQKLESIGMLAGGIAHDFNNLLTGIFGYIEMAREYLTSNDEASEMLSHALNVWNMAKDLTHQLLTFSKGGMPVKRILTITKFIKDNVFFVLSGTNIKCEFDVPEDLWSCDIDENQIGQVIDNIVINAKQAMPDGGTINIKVENVVITSGINIPLESGNYVKISIKDNGFGISLENQKKIYDPFFTTKQNGSGLGLTSTYSIIKKHEGFIDLDSEVGKGTTFYIYLPAVKKSKPGIEKSTSVVFSGHGKILVMDDMDFLRNLTIKMLTNMGYTADTASDGKEAIELYKKALTDGFPYDLVILDLTIQGGMSGVEALSRLLEINPGIRAIATSGYSDDPVMSNPKLYGFSGTLFKPYTYMKLGETIQKINELRK